MFITPVLLISGTLSVYSSPPKKVAILGGGFSSCTTALALTSQPDWQERYDITIYQLGWRLGGKAASGRNKHYGQRVEEITNHLFPGFYYNTKQMMRKVYEELDRPEGAPLRTFEETFKAYKWFKGTSVDPTEEKEKCLLLETVMEKLTNMIFTIVKHIAKLKNIHAKFDFINFAKGKYDPTKIESTVNSIKADILKTGAVNSPLIRELFGAIDVIVAVTKGILADGILEKGFDVINDLDLRQWLRKHGASQNAVDSELVKLIYDLVISYRNGNHNEPDMEAGTGLRMSLHFFLCYNEIILYAIQTGLGDAAFSPIYQVLKEKGVTFKFFHRVEELLLNSNNPKMVEEVKITQQACLKKNNFYDPLIDVKGLPVWPNEPKYDEIVEEEASLLQQHDVDLESFWTDWPTIYEEHFKQPLPELTLKGGDDFDIIVYGIPVASLPYLCPELLEVSPSLRSAHEHIGTTASQVVQLWTDESLYELSSSNKYRSSIVDDQGKQGMYYLKESKNSVLLTEDWESIGMNPKHLIYLSQSQNISGIPSKENTDFPNKCKLEAKTFALSEIQTSFENIWPNAFNNGEFNWTILTDPENRIGMERFDSQYWRSNVNPSDRYVQCLTNSSQYRISTDGAGFENIYFTGDWIRTSLNTGSIEGAVLAGLQTSRAISGYPEEFHEYT